MCEKASTKPGSNQLRVKSYGFRVNSVAAKEIKNSLNEVFNYCINKRYNPETAPQARLEFRGVRLEVAATRHQCFEKCQPSLAQTSYEFRVTCYELAATRHQCFEKCQPSLAPKEPFATPAHQRCGGEKTPGTQ